MSEEKMQYYLEQYGIEAINLVCKRHDLSSKKRIYFGARRNVPGTEYEAVFTEEMASLTEEINAIDEELLMKYSISKKESPLMIKVIKKCFPEDWKYGFS